MNNSTFKIDLGKLGGPLPTTGTFVTPGDNGAPVVSINFDTINTAYNGTKCTFDAYYFKNYFGTSGANKVKCINPDPNLNDNTKGFDTEFLFINFYRGLLITKSDLNVTQQSNYCHFEVSNYDCKSLFFTYGSDSMLDASQKTIAAGTTASTTTGPSTTNGLNILCGASNDPVSFDYTGLTLSINNDYLNTNSKYSDGELVFTPKSGTTGTLVLGNGGDVNGSINDGFSISHIEDQSGEFHLIPVCAVDTNGHNYVSTTLDNISIILG